MDVMTFITVLEFFLTGLCIGYGLGRDLSNKK